MQAVANGDPRAFAALSARWSRPLHAFLHRASGGREVDDLYQETWLRVVRGARGFDPARRFSTWLFQIALNLTRDRARRFTPEPVADATLDVAAAAASDPRTHTDALDAALDARRLLAALPEPQREVVLLRVLQDVGEEETAEIVGCPRGTVKSRLHHAMERLAALARGDAS